MNDEHDADPDDVTSDPEVDAEQDARIRALLAELGSGPDGEPIPPEVEARLDDTLALLVAERGRAAGGPGERRGRRPSRRPATSYPCAGAGCRAPGRQPPRSSCWASAAWPWPTSAVCPSRSSRAPRTAPVRRRPRRSPGLTPRLESKAGSDSSTGATQLPDLSAASFESDVSILLQGRASMLASEGEAAGRARLPTSRHRPAARTHCQARPVCCPPEPARARR